MSDAVADRGRSSGTLTFLFTDIEGSTRLWERYPEAMKAALGRHDEILKAAIAAAGGDVVKTMGDGLMAVFPDVGGAARAALAAQRDLAAEPWGDVGELLVRMGLHAGVAHASDGDFHGRVVNRAARIMGVAHGGQVLLSAAVAALLGDELPDGAELRDLGEHRLRDLERGEHLFTIAHPDLPADLPPPASLTQRPNNLPTQTSTFVGRDRELAEIREQIASSETRLLTLLGPGGTGKTRLALQAAADLVDRFDDGVFLVDLSGARDAEAVLALITRAVGLEESPDGLGLDDMVDQLRSRAVLLVLDNFEQVMSAAPTVVELLAACSELKVLVTSREALRVRGERVLAIPPLGLPEDPALASSAATLADAEAVQLFVDRARAVRSDFELTDDVAPAVAAICVRLDGLPLAIELAVARLNLFSPQALLERLEAGTKVLGGGPRDLPERQQTLRDTIDWSYDLLDPADRLLFRLLSLFASVSLETAEGVISELGSTLPEEVDVIDGLSSLVDKSLLRREEDVGGSPRFAMLGTIREYATSRLDEDPTLAVAARATHATYFAAFARERWTDLARRKRGEIVAELAVEGDDLQAAWRHWVEAGDPGPLNDLLHPLWLLYDARGWHRATVELTTDMLEVIAAAPDAPGRTEQEVTLLTSLARVMLATKGYTDEVADVYRRALELAEREGGLDLFPVLRGLSSLYNFRAEYSDGAEVGARLLALAEEQDDRSMRVEAHLVVGSNAAFRNDLDGGLAHLDRAIELMDPEADMARRFRFGPYPGVACLTTSAFLLWERGYPDQARARTERALAVAADLEHPITLAYASYHVGFLHLLWQELAVPTEQARRVREFADEYDLTLWRALGNCLEGAVKVRAGRAEGLEQLDAGLRRYEGLTAPPVFWPFLLFLKAAALGQAGRPDEGIGILHEAIAADAALGDRETDGLVAAPEFLLLLGDLLLASGDAAEGQAIGAYENALAIADDMDLRMPRLRAATALYRLRRDGPAGEEAQRLLRSAYDSFTEGHDAIPLTEAAALLT